jgi:hypothetical protein
MTASMKARKRKAGEAVAVEEEVLRFGTWMYDGLVPLRVRLRRMNWNGWLPNDDEEPPVIGPDGWAYFVDCQPISRAPDCWSPSRPCLTLDEAMSEVERRLPGGVRWDDDGVS